MSNEKDESIMNDMVIPSCEHGSLKSLKGALHGSMHHSFQDAKVSQKHVCLRFMFVKT